MHLNQFGSEETCYILSNTDGSIERGCTLDVNNSNVDPNWCYESEDCGECMDDACNKENIYFTYCLQCDSLNDENCAIPVFGSNEFYVKCTSIHYDEVEQHDINDDAHNQSDTHTQTYTHIPYPFSKSGCYSLKQGENEDFIEIVYEFI